MSCEICRVVGRGGQCELCEKCYWHHGKKSPCVSQLARADYQCVRCGVQYQGPIPTQCPKCKSLYVKRRSR